MANKGLNRATLIGNLGSEPEYRTTPTGIPVCTIRVATPDNYKDRNGEWQEATDWHNIVLWDKQADVAHQYLKKGDRVYIEGKIKTRTYEKDGITRYITEIRAENMIMLAPKGKEVQESGGYSASVSDVSKEIDTSVDDEEDVPF